MRYRLSLAKLSGMDFSLLIANIALTALGILFIFSANVSSDGRILSDEYLRQALFATIGLLLLLVIASLDIDFFKEYALWIYLSLIALVVYTLFFGKVVNGAKSWIGLGGFGIQPSELLKPATILLLAKYLEKSANTGVKPLMRLAVALCLVGLPVLLLLRQPDMGTALVFIPILFAVCYLGGITRRYLVFLITCLLLTLVLAFLPHVDALLLKANSPIIKILSGGAFVPFIIAGLALVVGLSFWGFRATASRLFYWLMYASSCLCVSLGAGFLGGNLLQEYQVKRLIVFLAPDKFPNAEAWNILQSLNAIGSGGVAGQGFLQGPQIHSGFVPEKSTDFIFSVIAEEWGFLGGSLVFFLFALVLVRGYLIMRRSRDSFSVMVVGGILGMLFYHFAINVGMTMGVMPVTGIPLPFISYGGSSLLSILASMGLIQCTHLGKSRFL
jgi:rod shape determining protein RodA